MNYGVHEISTVFRGDVVIKYSQLVKIIFTLQNKWLTLFIWMNFSDVRKFP